MKSTREKLQDQTPFVCPVNVISSIYNLLEHEERFLDAAKNEDLETINEFIDRQKHQSDVGEGKWRIFILADTALILATHENKRDVVKLLLSKGFMIREPHSRSCQCEECSSLGVLLKSLSRLNTYKVMSNPTYLSYCYLYAVPLALEPSPGDPPSSSNSASGVSEVDTFRAKLDPIYRAFELNGKLERLADTEYEFKKEYRQLSNQCEEYVVDLLNLCQNMDEIACVMSMPDIQGDKVGGGETTDLSVLNFAIKNKNERFVAHPYSQLMLNSVLYRGLHGWQYRSILTKDILISLWVIGMIFEEVKEYVRQGGQRYFSQWWNIVTIVMLALFVLAGLLWFMGHNAIHASHAVSHSFHNEYLTDVFGQISQEWAFKFLLLSNTFYSMAFILSFLHISNTLQVNSTIGPLHLSLVQMCADVSKFLLLFSMLYFAFGLALRKVYSQYVLISSIPYLNSTSPAVHKFADVSGGFADLFWALFDKTDLDAFKIGRPEFKITEVTGEMLFAVYNIAAILVALNMLIAMMANSFQKVADDADIQWKFSRTRMWMQYVDKGSDVPPPFNLIPNWKAIVSGVRWIYKRMRKKQRKTIIPSLIMRYFAKKAEKLNDNIKLT
ncbi:hypothetical protein QZH41_015042 [Actinostola sp. cb2023]|nr:hypothetical protein QZH41_015042 [Actinostola sp. cb2023]